MCEQSADNHKSSSRGSTVRTCYGPCFCGLFSPVQVSVPRLPSVDGVCFSGCCVHCTPIRKALCLVENERIQKSHWVCDYADDIFKTLRDAELRRYMLAFRSEQCGDRPVLVNILKAATEKYNLARTTLHLAVYLLDCFMDHCTIRPDKMNLTTITCLMVAAKIEEADAVMPKFAQLNEIVGSMYSLPDFKSVETKLLVTLNFDFLRPTAATFAEYFANCCLTLDDYHLYITNWRNGTLDYRKQHQPGELQLAPLYTNYEDMALSLNKVMFAVVDTSLNYLKFANVRPSVIAAASIAAVRRLHYVFPTWTPYLETLTGSAAEVIGSYVDALLVLYKLHGIATQRKEELAAATVQNLLYDSHDSGFISSDTNSNHSLDAGKPDEDGDPYSSPECSLPKKRRLF